MTEPELPVEQRYRLHGVERALDALEFLAAAGPGGVTLTELAEQIKVSKSSAFALLQTLVARGFVADSGTRLSRRYRLGMVLATLGDAVAVQSPLASLAMPILQSLTDATGLTTRMVVPDGPFAVVTARVHAPGTVRFASYLGKREYPHCTSAGKALLSALPAERAQALAVAAGMPARTERTITDPAALLRELELSAARGYAIDDEEDTEGVFCVGAPVYDRSGGCVAAISGTGLKLNRSTWRMDELGLTIREAADQITAALGGPPFPGRPSGWPAGTAEAVSNLLASRPVASLPAEPSLAVFLGRYHPDGDTEARDLERVRTLADAAGDPWRRDLPLHVTASALIVHPPTARVLLRWHQRQRAWLQVGGHGDPGESDPLAIAIREAQEETGLADLAPWPDAGIRHVAIVGVPPGKGEPAHEHADIRYLLATQAPDAARAEAEDAPLRWLSLAAAYDTTSEANLRETLARAERLLAH